MLTKLIPLSHCLITPRPEDIPVACHAGQYYSAQQFLNSVKHWTEQFTEQPFQRYALFTEDAYPFAVLLFSLLQAGKQIWLPGNNRPGTLEQLSQECQLLGDWQTGQSFDYCLQASAIPTQPLAPLNAQASQLVIFTSGSTGQAKPINKCLNQFQLEIKTLEKLWGEQLGNAVALATVSHQHIYGLLFRVLWPLSAGRCFHSQAFINPETLIHAAQQQSSYWIASPAHLKRLDKQSPWEGIADLKAIFSSGGALPEHAEQQILDCCGQAVIEVYGSSETGGIGWRQQTNKWTLFSSMSLTNNKGNWMLQSPYLESSPLVKAGLVGDFQLEDQITQLIDGRFLLHDRTDRIVKIEEKRLSLTELEQRLQALLWIAEAHALVISKSRDLVAVAVVLNDQGLEYKTNHGRNGLLKELRFALSAWFEVVLLPKKWLLVNTMPLTTQGKVDQELLKSLLLVPVCAQGMRKKFPQVLNLEINQETIVLGLKVSEDLLYFADHFTAYPILPGVVQLAWAEYFGKLFFAIAKPFSCLETVKFMKTIQPGDELTLTLSWKADMAKLYFNFSSEHGVYSSGRMVYEGNA